MGVSSKHAKHSTDVDVWRKIRTTPSNYVFRAKASEKPQAAVDQTITRRGFTLISSPQSPLTYGD